MMISKGEKECFEVRVDERRNTYCISVLMERDQFNMHVVLRSHGRGRGRGDYKDTGECEGVTFFGFRV